MNLLQMLKRTLETIKLRLSGVTDREILNLHIPALTFHWDAVEELLNLYGDNLLYVDHRSKCVKLSKEYSRFYDQISQLMDTLND